MEKYLAQNNQPQDKSETLTIGEFIETPWGGIRLDRFDQEDHARLTVLYDKAENPLVVTTVGDIFLFGVDEDASGMTRVATVTDLTTKSVSITVYAQPEFVPHEFTGVPNLDIDQILGANSTDELMDLFRAA